MTKLLTNIAIASNPLAATLVLPSIANPAKNRLLAR